MGKQKTFPGVARTGGCFAPVCSHELRLQTTPTEGTGDTRSPSCAEYRPRMGREKVGGRRQIPRRFRRRRLGVLRMHRGREAAARKTRLTMDEPIKENKKLEVDLTDLKA
jgi:hypothetical protein